MVFPKAGASTTYTIYPVGFYCCSSGSHGSTDHDSCEPIALGTQAPLEVT